MTYDIKIRPRRLRRSRLIREIISETTLSLKDLIYPVFVSESINQPKEILSMPGIYRWPLISIEDQLTKWTDLGLSSFAIFPCVEESKKNSLGSEILNPKSISYEVGRKIKSLREETLIFADLALDPFTTHGHDGLINDSNCIDNDRTVEVLAKASVLAAEAGYDFVAPSDMMDGRVSIIRKALDEAAHEDVGIMAYSAKFCSAYYGPFREAVGSMKEETIDKSTYQINPANSTEAAKELSLDATEGADILMVKPAEPYLDVIKGAKDEHRLPIAAYQVSGEYSRIHAAAKLGWLDLVSCANESLICIKRAGADLIITYFAEEIARQSKSN